MTKTGVITCNTLVPRCFSLALGTIKTKRAEGGVIKVQDELWCWRNKARRNR